MSPFLALAFRLILPAGLRKDEALTLRWEDVDLDDALLALPDTKTGPKRLTLSDEAVSLLRRAPRQEGSPRVVTGDRLLAGPGYPARSCFTAGDFKGETIAHPEGSQ